MAGKKLTIRRAGFLPVILFLFFSCSFDYGSKAEAENDQPDIVMEEVEYVRVRGGDPQVRFQAELAERFEEKQTMNLKQFTFEQFQKNGAEVDARGSAGQAQVELGSGNIHLSGGVKLSVDSEDIIIQTDDLRWHDKEKGLAGSPGGAVDIERSDGTGFSGRGFSANVRSRTWGFDTGVTGLFVEDDEEDEENDAGLAEASSAAESGDSAAEASSASESGDSAAEASSASETANAGSARGGENAAGPEAQTDGGGEVDVIPAEESVTEAVRPEAETPNAGLFQDREGAFEK